MNKEILSSKGFIVKFYLILLFGGLAMIIPIISRVYLAPWCILNVLFMLNVFYAICRFKAKKGLFVVCLLFLLIMTLIIYYYAGGLVCMSILIFGEPLYESDFLSLRIFLHILFWGPATIVYLVYLLLEYIAWKKGYISSRIKHVKWGFNDFCSSYVGMTALAYFPFSYYCILLHILITEPPHMYSTYGSYMLGDWLVANISFFVISLYVIHYLCRKGHSMKLYCLAMVNAGIGVLLWIVIAKALKCAGEEISYVWIHYPLILNIPMIVMLILFFRAKRMARHSSEEIEVVEEVEYITFEKTENSAEWKMDEQSAPEQEKKSETRMETDF